MPRPTPLDSRPDTMLGPGVAGHRAPDRSRDEDPGARQTAEGIGSRRRVRLWSPLARRECHRDSRMSRTRMRAEARTGIAARNAPPGSPRSLRRREDRPDWDRVRPRPHRWQKRHVAKRPMPIAAARARMPPSKGRRRGACDDDGAIDGPRRWRLTGRYPTPCPDNKSCISVSRGDLLVGQDQQDSGHPAASPTGAHFPSRSPMSCRT